MKKLGDFGDREAAIRRLLERMEPMNAERIAPLAPADKRVDFAEVFKKISAFEMEIIARIGKRASKIAANYGVQYETSTAIMDLCVVHVVAAPMDLNALEKADDRTFVHDMFGIRRYLDRSSGKLQDAFLPQCAMW